MLIASVLELMEFYCLYSIHLITLALGTAIEMPEIYFFYDSASGYSPIFVALEGDIWKPAY